MILVMIALYKKEAIEIIQSALWVLIGGYSFDLFLAVKTFNSIPKYIYLLNGRLENNKNKL